MQVSVSQLLTVMRLPLMVMKDISLQEVPLFPEVSRSSKQGPAGKSTGAQKDSTKTVGIAPVPQDDVMRVQAGNSCPVRQFVSGTCGTVRAQAGAGSYSVCDPPGGPPGDWIIKLVVSFCVVLAQSNLPWAVVRPLVP